MGFPLADWQFWSVTACAVGAVWLLVKPFLGRGGSPAAGACASCPKVLRAVEDEDAGRERLVSIGKAR